MLCDLEGLTHQQAAERLRCPVGTIGVRLKRARQRLRERLTRRGVVPSVGVMAAVLGADTASALTSPSLINSTIQAGIEFAASTGTNSLISASVITLAEGVLRTMALARLKLPAIAGAGGRDDRDSRLAGHRAPPTGFDPAGTGRFAAAGRGVR